MISSRQRILSAIDHKLSDRVPITFDAQPEVYQVLHDHFGTQTKKDLFDKLGVDTWMLLPENFLFYEKDKYSEVKTSIWGFKTRLTAYSGGTYDELIYNPLAAHDRIEDIKRHNWPDENTISFNNFRTEAIQAGDRARIGAFTWGPYFIASHVRGLENLMMDFVLNKAYAHALINTISDLCLMFLEKMLSSYSDCIEIVYMADDYCSQQGPLFSSAMFDEFVMPYLAEIVSVTHRYNKKFLLHVCGSVREFIPRLINAGVDILEPIQTRAAGMDPGSLKRDFGKDICFYGGVDLQETLCRGTLQQVEKEVKHLINVLGNEGGYILGPGHTYIQIDAPVQNILMMYQTARFNSY